MTSRFEGVLTDYGFDKSTNPPWAMVPLGGFKRVRLTEAANLTLTSTFPGIATVGEAPGSKPAQATRDFLIQGKMKGTAFIEARRGKLLMARLEVAVKPRKTVKVAFNFVEDKGGHKTKRKAGSVDGWIEEINKIYLPQANIEFKKHSARTVKIDKNLGKVVRFSKHLAGVPAVQHEWDLVTAKGDGTADFNIFFVWEYEQDATPLKDHTDAGTLGGNCIFEDRAGSEVAETLAHEAGHFLGCDDTYADTDKHLLMYGITDVRGKTLLKSHINTMNP